MPKLLVVDDSATVLSFLQAMLESEHFDVMTATDGHDGLAKVHQSMPDLVVTDSIMPGLDGFDFLRALREDPATESLPVVMLTAGDPQDPEYAHRQPRPDAFVKKSADLGPLLKEIQEALARRR